MLFTGPVPFSDAMKARKVKAILPTTLSSEQLSDIEPQILERSLFSARTTSAAYLQGVGDELDDILAGKKDFATARLELKKKLGELGYAPEPANAETIKDLSSDARLNLVLKTNTDMARGFGQWMQSQDPDVLDQFPAQELYRLEAREVPRDWIDRWTEAGGELYGGRMLAPVNDTIWTLISAFGQPYPPFDYNSGMWTRLIDRDEAVELGVVTDGQMIQPKENGLNDLLGIAMPVRQGAILKALMDFGYSVANGILSLA